MCSAKNEQIKWIFPAGTPCIYLSGPGWKIKCSSNSGVSEVPLQAYQFISRPNITAAALVTECQTLASTSLLRLCLGRQEALRTQRPPRVVLSSPERLRLKSVLFRWPPGLCHGHSGGLQWWRMWDQALGLTQATRKVACY